MFLSIMQSFMVGGSQELELLATWRRGTDLKRVNDSVRDVSERACFDCGYYGLTLQAVDKTHLELIFVILDRATFVKYRCQEGFRLGLNHKHLHTILGYVTNDDVVELKVRDLCKARFALDEPSQGKEWAFSLYQVVINKQR